MTANDYIDYDLIAVQPTQRLQGNLFTVVDTVSSNSVIGKIYSWVTDSTGNVYWMLYDSYAPGKNMYVKHNPDTLQAVTPSQSVINVTVPGVLTDLSTAASTGTFGSLIDFGKYALIAIIGIKAISLFKK